MIYISNLWYWLNPLYVYLLITNNCQQIQISRNFCRGITSVSRLDPSSTDSYSLYSRPSITLKAGFCTGLSSQVYLTIGMECLDNTGFKLHPELYQSRTHVQIVSYKCQPEHKLLSDQAQTNKHDLIGSECQNGHKCRY